MLISLEDYEKLVESSAKANALIAMALAVPDLEILSATHVQNYLWVLADVLNQVDKVCRHMQSA